MGVRVLDNKQVDRKIIRLAYEIYENNPYEKVIYMLGINTNGFKLASLLAKQVEDISSLKCELNHISMSPSSPVDNPITLDIELKKLENKVVIIVDDVANTGRTLFYAFQPLLQILTKKIETAVLVDRQHKHYPVKVDYVGLSLATTLQENIDVILKGRQKEVLLT